MTAAESDAFEQRVLRTAEQAFARVMRGVDEQVERMPPDLEPADALRWAGDRMTELLADFAELPLDRMLGLAAPAAATGTDAPPPRGEPVVVRAVHGSVAEARVWVHVVGELSATTLRFALSDLVGPDGDPWSSPGAGFTPAEISLPTTVGSATLLSLPIPDDATPGDHHGLVIGRGVTGAVVPVTVVIT